MTSKNIRNEPQRRRVAVIGAGISGLSAAETLVSHGLQVVIFEKSRGVGGRMATRRLDDQSSFDHGAQYFTVRDPHFRQRVDAWIEQKLVAVWPDLKMGPGQRIVVLKNGQIDSQSDSIQRFVGVPGMNAICRHLANGQEIRKETRVARIELEKAGIQLFDDREQSLGCFDRLIVSAPSEQTAELLSPFPMLANPIAKLKMHPCWAIMAVFAKPVTDQWVGAFVHDSSIAWAGRNSTKPGRSSSREHLVLHAQAAWTADHWDREADQVAREMLDEFWRATRATVQNPIHLQAHRWKYAIPDDAAEVGCFFDSHAGIAACGDWAGASRVEGAFRSGISAGEIIARSFGVGT